MKTQRAEEAGGAEVRLKFSGDLLEAGDLGVTEFLGKPAALADDFVERVGGAAEVKRDAVKLTAAVVGPGAVSTSPRAP